MHALRLSQLATIAIALFSSCLALAQEATQDLFEEASVDDSAFEQALNPPGPLVVKLEVWLVTLSEQADVDTLEIANQRFENRANVDKRIKQLKNQGVVSRSRYLRTDVLDEQQATVTLSKRQPRIQAAHKTKAGTQNNVVYDDIGTILHVRTRVENDSLILAELQLEDSYQEPSQTFAFHPTEGDPEQNIPQVVQFVFGSTVACASGDAVVALGTDADSGAEGESTYVYWAARIVD